MKNRAGTRMRRVRDELRRGHPSVGNPDAVLLLSSFTVDGQVVLPHSLMKAGAPYAYALASLSAEPADRAYCFGSRPPRRSRRGGDALSRAGTPRR